jgi:hypothetical protein
MFKHRKSQSFIVADLEEKQIQITGICREICASCSSAEVGLLTKLTFHNKGIMNELDAVITGAGDFG